MCKLVTGLLTKKCKLFSGRDSFPTDVLPLTKSDLKTITKKNGWNFDWKSEFLKPDRDVYKLTITNNTEVIL